MRLHWLCVGISCCPFFILSNPFLNGFTPYSLNATCCDDCRCFARALEFVPGATANADSLAKVTDCHQLHSVHMLCLSLLWSRFLYKIVYHRVGVSKRYVLLLFRFVFAVRIRGIYCCRKQASFFSLILFFLFSSPITLLDSVAYSSKCEQSRV